MKYSEMTNRQRALHADICKRDEHWVFMQRGKRLVFPQHRTLDIQKIK